MNFGVNRVSRAAGRCAQARGRALASPCGRGLGPNDDGADDTDNNAATSSDAVLGLPSLGENYYELYASYS